MSEPKISRIGTGRWQATVNGEPVELNRLEQHLAIRDALLLSATRNGAEVIVQHDISFRVSMEPCPEPEEPEPEEPEPEEPEPEEPEPEEPEPEEPEPEEPEPEEPEPELGTMTRVEYRVGADGLLLSWDPVVGAERYRVRVFEQGAPAQWKPPVIYTDAPGVLIPWPDPLPAWGQACIRAEAGESATADRCVAWSPYAPPEEPEPEEPEPEEPEPEEPEPEEPEPGNPIEGGHRRIVHISTTSFTALGEHDVLIVAVVDANDDVWAPVELIDGTRGWVTVEESPGALTVAENYRWHPDADAGIQAQSETPDVLTYQHTIIYRPNPPLSDLPVLVTWEV